MNSGKLITIPLNEKQDRVAHMQYPMKHADILDGFYEIFIYEAIESVIETNRKKLEKELPSKQENFEQM